MMSGCFSDKTFIESIKREILERSKGMHAFPPLTTSSPKLLLPLIFVNLAEVLQTRELIHSFVILKK